ncbi:AMP-binding protein [Paraburkholderia dilworthii]|uniref:AMP-binding protein n=1 Tax=Paraburkholderia dilworthii TaxID=948106 RepID=UPI0004197FD4|nr:AMP-binding protein [Paraburkholderia dilworthii]
MDMSLPLRPDCVDVLVDRHVRAGRGSHPALIECADDKRRVLTYAQLAAVTKRFAGELAIELGGGRAQQRVAIVGSSTLETIAAWLATMRAGHLPFLVHPQLDRGAYEAIFSDFDPVRVLCDRTASVPDALPLPAVETYLSTDVESPGPGWPDAATHWPDLASMRPLRAAFCLASSGSTGRPKICVHSHQAIALFEQHVTRPMWNLRPNDVVLGTSGPYFSFGLQGIHPAMSIGATAVLLPQWHRHEAFLATIERERVTVFLAVPTLCHLLMTRASRAYQLDSLRLCLSAGERFPVVLRNRWQAFCGAPTLDSVGTTETFLPYLSEVVGEAPGMQEVGAFEYTWTASEREFAESGEVPENVPFHPRVAGDALMLGRYTSEGDGGFVPAAHVFESGDLFLRHDSGWHFVSRRSERAKVAGHWVSPQDLEDFLLVDPRVLKAAALPVETEEGLTRLRAYIVLVDPEHCTTAVVDELMQRMHRELRPGALRPDRIEVVAELQSTPSGKLKREELRSVQSQGVGCVPF